VKRSLALLILILALSALPLAGVWAEAGVYVVPASAAAEGDDAIEDRIRAAHRYASSTADTSDRGIVRLSPLPPGECYAVDDPITVLDNVTIRGSGEKGADSPVCNTRTLDREYLIDEGIVGTPDHKPDTIYSIFEGRGTRQDALRRVTFDNLTIDGGKPGYLESDIIAGRYIRERVVVTAVFVNAQSTSREPAHYAREIAVTNSVIRDVPGVCLSFTKVVGFRVDSVDCLDPSKGGLIFNFGSRDGVVSDSRSLSTGDDAIAFNSASSALGVADSGADPDPGIFEEVSNVSVVRSQMSQNRYTAAEAERVGAGGASLAIRGAHDVRATRNTLDDASSGVVGYGATTRGAVLISDGNHESLSFKPYNIYLHDNRITNALEGRTGDNGVAVRTSGVGSRGTDGAGRPAHDLSFASNHIRHDSNARCFLFETAAARQAATGVAGNTCVPVAPSE
jgi:hypothetical protein